MRPFRPGVVFGKSKSTGNLRSHWQLKLLSLATSASLTLSAWLTMSPAFAISENLKKTLHWEFYANSANNPEARAQQKQRIQHYEVPVELLNDERQYELSMPEELKNALYFEKMVNGEKKGFVRWIINPEDTKHHFKVQKFLQKRGYDATPKTYFNGYLTASRSIYLEDPNSGVVFSGKVSTNKTGGKFRDDKLLNLEDVAASKHSNRLAARVLSRREKDMKTLKLITEPTGLYLSAGGSGLFSSGLHQGFLVRDLQPIDNGNFYLPGFAALHDTVGKEIAEKNGSDDPVAFWTRNYAEPLGRALAELAGLFGFAMTSAHNQQFLIELDKDMKPTGQILLRDFNDSHVFAPFYRPTENEEDKELKSFYRRTEDMTINFGLFHGTTVPSWVDKDDVKTMARAFFRNFDQRYSEITGLPLEMFSRKKPTVNKPPRYSIKIYGPGDAETPVEKKLWKDYFEAGECFRGAQTLPDGRDCEEVLRELRGRVNLDLQGLNKKCKDGKTPEFFKKLFSL